MTTQELRQKYPKFIYEKYEYKLADGNLETSFYYSLPPDHKFIHRLTLENYGREIASLDNLIFHIGLSLMPSYWKLACSPTIEINAGSLTSGQIDWWHKLFIKGMGEYFFRNNIDFTYPDFLNITCGDLRTGARADAGNKESQIPNDKVLIPVGGGKDSIVTLELLKNHFQVTPFIVNPVPEMLNVCRIAGFENPLLVRSIFDPLLFKLNDQGYLNGHTPVSSVYAFISVLVAALTGHKYIAFSNERSSNEGNTEYLDRTINHQYSKTLEFETDLNSYLISHFPDVKYFSFLRPLYELQISEIFCRFPQYFSVFTGCNSNFKINPAVRLQNSLWCNHCPKCVSTALLIAAWLGKSKVTGIMGAYPPDLPENSEILKDLLGINPVKPFECVLTHDEAHIAEELISHGPSKNSRMFMSGWLENPNLPPEFEKILKAYITRE